MPEIPFRASGASTRRFWCARSSAQRLWVGLGAAATLAGCGAAPVAPDAGAQADALQGELVIVTPHRADIRREFERAFRARYPGATIRWDSQKGTGEALRFVQQKFASPTVAARGAANTNGPNASGIGADIFFGGGPETFLELEARGWLQALPSDYGVPPELNGVPLRSYDKKWVAAALSRFGILFNRPLAARLRLPVPREWAELGDPALRGQVELVDPRRSGSARVIYESVLQLYGWERGWQVLTAMAGNARPFVVSSSRPLDDVAQGRAAFAPSVNFLAQTAIARARETGGAAQLGYIEPRAQQVITPDPIGILRGAPHRALARAFVAFVLSDEGQKLWMLRRRSRGGPVAENLYRLSVLPSLYEPLSPDSVVRSDPYAERNVRLYDAQKAAHRHKALEDLIGAVLIENQAALRARWERRPDAARLAFVPVNEAQLARLAAHWNDPALRAATVRRWSRAARRHFARADDQEG